VIWIGVSVVAAMALFPPWTKDLMDGTFVGYHFVNTAYDHGFGGGVIDWTRLVLQASVVSLATLVVVTGLKRPRRLSRSQIAVSATGLALVTLVAAWPPWSFMFWGNDFAGYHHFFTTDPPVRPTGVMAVIDPVRCGIQIGVVLLLSVAVTASLRGPIETN